MSAVRACQVTGTCPSGAMYASGTALHKAAGIHPFSATGAFVVKQGDGNAFRSELDVSGRCVDCSGVSRDVFMDKCVEPPTNVSFAVTRFAACSRHKHFESERGSGEIPTKISQRDGTSTSRHALAASSAGMYGVASVDDLADATYMRAQGANPL